MCVNTYGEGKKDNHKVLEVRSLALISFVSHNLEKQPLEQ